MPDYSAGINLMADAIRWFRLATICAVAPLFDARYRDRLVEPVSFSVDSDSRNWRPPPVSVIGAVDDRRFDIACTP